MVENVFIRLPVALFTRGCKEIDLHYVSHLSCQRSHRSMKRFTNTELADMYLIYGLTEGNARVAERLHHERDPQTGTRTIGIGTPNMVLGFFRTVSNPFCSMCGIKYVGCSGSLCGLPSLCLLPCNDLYLHKV
ncbi:hypothetical protein TNCV_4059841 [Trichonephila clavipes]|nr:hypothetical protein TNCV_4059841 [Trichonephila clavipes]